MVFKSFYTKLYISLKRPNLFLETQLYNSFNDDDFSYNFYILSVWLKAQHNRFDIKVSQLSVISNVNV